MEKVTKSRLEVLLLLIFCLSFLAVYPAHAAQTANSSVVLTGASSNSLTFEVIYKNTVRPTGATFDGVEIEGFDLQHNLNYTASNLEANTSHYFCIYKDLYNCEKGTTLPSNDQKVYDFFWQYFFFIIAIICITIGLRVPFIALAGCGFSIIGIVSVISVSFWAGFIFMVVFCAGIFVAFKPGE